MTQTKQMKTIEQDPLQVIRASLLAHPLYAELDAPEKVRIFMRHHVFAVWDFMSLLKRLQQLLTVTTVPWMPGKETTYARFINEIVLGEETDEDGEGGYISHFDLYLQAMKEVGADTSEMEEFLHRMEQGASVEEALRVTEMPESVRSFVQQTMRIVQTGGAHEVAAAFFFGREDIIPDMFTHLVREIEENGDSAKRLVYYLQRHIELDGDQHGPLAQRLLDYLCGDDPKRIEEAQQTAKQCLESRIRLWDGVVADVRE
ncbi:MAG: DUF3050 domain-containing protein [Tumebacillaceae bacterium]